jgi:hypothetical protein
MSNVGRLLDQAATEGRLISEGTFTVELSKAADKLQLYRLEDPSRYILSLLACANSAGADHLWIKKREHGILVSHDGKTVSGAELEELFQRISLGAAASETYLTELGMAIQGARALHPDRVIFESGDGDSGSILILEGKTARIQKLSGLPKREGVHMSATNRLSLQWRKPSILSRVLGRNVRQAEEQVIRRFGRFSPCKIHWNGVPLPSPVLGGWSFSERLDGENRLIPMELIGTQRLRTDNPGSFSGYLGFGSTPGAWLVINDGVRFQLSMPETAPPTSRAIIFTTGLKKDLSGQKLVENSLYQSLLAALEVRFGQLAERFC